MDTVKDKALLSWADLICAKQALVLYLVWKQHHICPMLSVYVTVSEKQSFIWFLVAEDTECTANSNKKESFHWSQWRWDQTYMVKRQKWETCFGLIHYGCWFDAEANWPFCLLLNCLDYAMLSQSKCFFPLTTSRWFEQIHSSLGRKALQERTGIGITNHEFFRIFSRTHVLFLSVFANSNMLICFPFCTQHPY